MKNKPQRILMTADTIGGVWTYALELTKALGEYGVEVAIATMGAPLTSEQRHEVKQITNLTLFESNFKLEWMPNPWQDVQQAGEWLLQLEAQLHPDIVHLNGYAHASLPWKTPKLIVAHSCVLSWWQAVKGEAAPSEWELYRHAVIQGLQAADLVVAPSKAMLTALNQHYGVITNSQVILNGRDNKLFIPGEKSAFVLSVGRLWDEAKNVAALEKIAPQLNCPIYVAGDTQHPQGGNITTTQVNLLGRLSPQELAPWLTKAAIYALPARYEPFGLSVLEAGLAGCALVLGDIPSLRENWQDAAIFVHPDDLEALQAALNFLIANAVYRQNLAQKASDRALKFTSQSMAAKYLSAYSNLLQQMTNVLY
ncbi:MAG: glycosyltransferase family 4 protein [Mojavia pulchra JT2-VF2]|uniref:Glycosyltransferase family 4 protein n=1 Tax=Mojavia pulchra JT2-VF2 TaxID=287848 RepID=A0A951PW90_9NOST|nr:glycosyltransferase family 4 protein [Mojavia pulchra JT2-VF2]